MCKVQIDRDGATPFHFKISADELSLNDEIADVNFDDDILIDGEIINSGKSFDIRGTINCKKSFICDRCLKPSTENQEIKFDEEIDPTVIFDNIVDLENLIRDNLLAAQSIKNLCKEDCKGLCPKCGVDLNETTCDCDRCVIDPRLEALKNFKFE